MADHFKMNKASIAPLSESHKARQLRDQELSKKAAENKKAKIAQQKKFKSLARREAFGLAKQYRCHVSNIVHSKRIAKLNCGLYKEPEARVVFVVRIKGINKVCPKVRKILQLFRLRQLHNGVFLPVNKATTEMLKAIDPYVAYGYPSLAMVKKLIYKRGYLKVGKPGAWQRIRIQDNSIIQEKLASFGVYGTEGLVRELYFGGENFKKVTTLLWPFKLSSPLGGFIRKRAGFCEMRGGDSGNREHLINKLIDRMC